jgi:O-antigen/teichoic acid export membrane protein
MIHPPDTLSAEVSPDDGDMTAPPLEHQPHAPISLKAKTVRTSLWTLGGFGLSQIIRFASNYVLVRLLAPHDFGLAALVGIFVNMFQQFSDVGLGPAIIQSPRGDDERFLNTAWTLGVVRGIVLWLGTCAIAWPVAWRYHEPLLVPLIIVTGFNGVLTGLNSTSLFQLNRHMQAGKITVLNLTAQLITTFVMIAIASAYHSVWAIILAGVVASIFTLIATHFLIPGFRNRFAWDRDSLHELFHFGGWIFISTAVTFFANDADRLIFGYIASVASLGIYQQAATLVRMPIELISRLSAVSLFPALARSADLGIEPLTRKLLSARAVILPLGVAAVIGLAFGAPPFAHFFYTGKFNGVGRMAQCMAVGLWFTILQLSSDRTLLALGHARSLAMANAANMIGTIGFAFAGLAIGRHLNYPVEGFILGVALGTLIGHLVVQEELSRHGIGIYLQDAKYTVLVLAIGLVGWGVPRLGVQMFGTHHQFHLQLAMGLLVIVSSSAWAAAKAIRQTK